MTSSSASPARVLTRAKGREKPQLSCNFCRKRKLRCDRSQPCDSCTRLGHASMCTFPSHYAQSPRHLESINANIRTALQERVDHLESLVRSLAPKSPKSQSPYMPDSSETSSVTTASSCQLSDQISRDFGRIDLQNDSSSYTESDHWRAILEEIGDFKDLLGGNERAEDLDDAGVQPGLDLFLTQSTPVTKLDILSALPARAIVDGMIAKYFSSADMPVTLIIHRHAFVSQYESFWANPFGTSIIWVTILFGMMYQVAYYTLVMQDPGLLNEAMLSDYRTIVATARQKMMHCLHLGNYLKGSRYTIEALLFLLQIEYVQGEGAEYGCWQLIGVIVRIALKMGYHRDGSHFPDMSAFDAEMRRRVWYILIQFDIASAAQVGLPRIIKEAQCDTTEPHNLLDDDFDESTTTLPPSRSANEHTIAQFLIYKSRIVSVYGMICDFTTSSKQRHYNEAMNLDILLNRAYAGKPAVLEPKPMQKSIADGSHLITRRLYIAMSYHHAQMTLHRKFMIAAKTDRTYAYSYATCLKAARSALKYQADLCEQCQPGRMLCSDRWKILSLIQSEFLLATTILCLDLDDEATRTRRTDSTHLSSLNFETNIKALKGSRAIWIQQQDTSLEAQTAIKAIDIVLGKINQSLGTGNKESSPSFTEEIQETQNHATNAAFGLGHSQPLLPNQVLADTIASNQQDSMDWNELFDLDVPWDSWVQL